MRFSFALLPVLALLPALVLAQRPASSRMASRPRLAVAATKPAPRTAPSTATVPWSAGRPLTVADFQGRPASGEAHAALTSAKIDAKGACRDNFFTADVRAVFDPSTSWVRDPATMPASLLRHEQLHFDIAELYARRLRMGLASARPDCVQLQSVFSRISQRIYREWEQEESRYDQESNHGLNTVQQVFWERQTAVRLQQLEAYALKEAE